ncbi:MAG: hypothetical protein D6690_00880 [Nitrospirae bacterium]|nr:MAG: hypothetical protein D6690_00880 [Nitrospirota bacterium]
MAPEIVVVIIGNPRQSHRPAEAMRIALGLSTGPNPLKLVLLHDARLLLTEEAPDLVDGEILEKHLPVVQECQIPIIVPQGSKDEFVFEPGFAIREHSAQEIALLIFQGDRVLIFT